MYVKMTRPGGISTSALTRIPNVLVKEKKMRPQHRLHNVKTKEKKDTKSLQSTVLYTRLQPRHGLNVCPPLLPWRHLEVPDRLGLRRRALEEFLTNGIGHGEDAGRNGRAVPTVFPVDMSQLTRSGRMGQYDEGPAVTTHPSRRHWAISSVKSQSRPRGSNLPVLASRSGVQAGASLIVAALVSLLRATMMIPSSSNL